MCGRRRPAAPGGAQPAPAPAMPVTAATRTRWLAVGASSSSQLDRENRRRFILCKAGHLLLPCSAKSASAAVAGTSASVRPSANAELAACLLKGSGGHAGGGDGLVAGEAGEGRDELPRHDDGVGRCPFEPFDGQNGEARPEELRAARRVRCASSGRFQGRSPISWMAIILQGVVVGQNSSTS